MEHYKNYVGQFVKRFYAPFEAKSIYKIKDYRVKQHNIDTEIIEVEEFLYDNGIDEPWWTDCEDSCIITNELPIKEIEWVANVNSDEYNGYNPFTGKLKTK